MSHLATITKSCGYTLLFATLIAQGLQAQGPNQTVPADAAAWDLLGAAPEGSRVKLSLVDGSLVRGRLVVARTDAVVVEDIQTGKGGITTPAGAWLGDRLTLPRTSISAIEVTSRPRGESGPQAQSFDQLGVLLRLGDKVSFTDTSGARFAGTIAGLSSSSLSVSVGGHVRELRESDVATIRQRRGDSLANGAKWGLGVGAALGMAACGRCHLGPGLMVAGVWGGIGAGIGVGLDALAGSDFVVFQSRDSTRRVTVAPQLAKSHKGVTVSVGF